MRSVLFICTANICRSPMAAGLWRARVGKELSDWRIESAGIYAVAGQPAAASAIAVLCQYQVDLRAHRSRPVTRKLIAAFHLILTMERGQKEALRAAFPEYAPRIYLLSEMLDKTSDVVDPMGRSRQDFMDTAAELDYLLEKGYQRLRALALGPEGQRNSPR